MAPDRTHRGRTLLRVDWQPGSDRLEGTCHCGAVHLADGPAEVWDWLLAHPVGHEPTAAAMTVAQFTAGTGAHR